MTLHESEIRPAALVTTVDYDDHDEIERMIAEGWQYVGDEQWVATQASFVESQFTARAGFLPRLENDLLVGDGIVLTGPLLGDAHALCEHQFDDAVRRNGVFAPTSRAAIESRIRDAYPGWRLGDATFLVARESATGPALSTLAIRRLVPPGVLDVGYATLSEHRGNGYAARALQTFSDWAFATSGVQRIELGIKPGNTASVTTALRAGYQLESVRRSRLRNPDGSYADEHSYVAINTDHRRVWNGAA